MESLEKLAKRIGEISDEISELKSKREINLNKCHESEDKEFNDFWNQAIEEGNYNLTNCLLASYEYVRESRSHGDHESFDEIIRMYGCKNCVAAYEAKRKIGILKQERGRLIGNISKIGKSL